MWIVVSAPEWPDQEVLPGVVVGWEPQWVEVKVDGDEVTWLVNRERVWTSPHQARTAAKVLATEAQACYDKGSNGKRVFRHWGASTNVPGGTE